jgi:predicted SAM-dependent methyltransferase
LPVQPETIQFIFNEHFLEHITQDQARALLTECYRVLVLNGTLRINTPDLKKLIEEYQAERTSEWINVGWCPSTPCRLMNEGMRLWQHKFLYDVAELENLLKECGFRKLRPMAWRESRHSEFKNLECRPFHGEIIIEATK